MILSKLNKILLIFFLFLITQCYKTPFFELTVQTVGQDLNPISNVLITIEVTDVETGDHVDGSIIYLESTTNNSGVAEFSFDKKAFISVKSCIQVVTLTNSGDATTTTMCKSGHVYLEENENKTLTLMVEEGVCSYCVF